MKSAIILLLLPAIIFIACEGKQGPMGPIGFTGSMGPQGPPGEPATIIIVNGTVGTGNYNGNWLQIYSSYIHDEDLVILYLCADPDSWAWFIPDEALNLTDGRVSINDQFRDYLGYDYMVKIIQY